MLQADTGKVRNCDCNPNELQPGLELRNVTLAKLKSLNVTTAAPLELRSG